MTVENDEQAWVRIKKSEKDKGGFAARAALTMIELREKLPAAQLPAWLSAHPQRTRGEFALLVHAVAKAQAIFACMPCVCAAWLRIKK